MWTATRFLLNSQSLTLISELRAKTPRTEVFSTLTFWRSMEPFSTAMATSASLICRLRISARSSPVMNTPFQSPLLGRSNAERIWTGEIFEPAMTSWPLLT